MGRRKASNKQDKANNRRNKKYRQKGRGGDQEEEGDETEMRVQLEKLGLALKEISGDGNCLFRALADQLYGHSKSIGGFHLKLRREVAEYIRQHREDFEPFVDEDITFDRHVELLEQDGTYAGQDALVAFARLYNVTIVIHQLNEPLWQIHGSPDGQTRCPKELHISYHNGDHYNSVRRIGDLTSNEPANLRIDIVQPSKSGCDDVTGGAHDVSDDEDEALSDYENTPNRMELDRRANEVRIQSGSTDLRLIYETLEQNGYNVPASVERILQLKASKGHANQEPAIWSQGGTGSRIFGDEVARAASTKVPTGKSDSRKDASKSKKRTKNKNQDDRRDSGDVVTLVPTMQTLSL